MRQGWLFAVTTSAVVGGAVFVSAQAPSAPSQRPFERLFSTTQAPRPTPSLAPRWEPPALPASPRKCHVVVVPADPRIDPRLSIAPPASRRFTIRGAVPVCR
jgi:hypothetical protein